MPLEDLYNSLPVIRELRSIRNTLWEQSRLTEISLAHLRRLRIDERLKQARYADSRQLNRFEHQVFSQNGEDGIIAEILRRLEIASPGVFVEIGVGDGLENNTGSLLAQGWAGVWAEANPGNVRRIRASLKQLIVKGRLKVIESFVTRENILEQLIAVRSVEVIDFLSIDVDQNTFWIWDGLRALSPKIVVVEYNASWPPNVDWTVPYDATASWDGTFAFGASLQAFTRMGNDLGYRLVACDLTGTNAFFVRQDLVKDRFLGPFDAATHYHAPDYALTPVPGQPRGYAAYFGEVSRTA